jgi:hypothetical protein
MFIIFPFFLEIGAEVEDIDDRGAYNKIEHNQMAELRWVKLTLYLLYK